MSMGATNQNTNRDWRVNSCKRICDLPDDLLGRILDMLPMKDAVRTSVLSRRWESLWTSLPDLIFDQFECRDGRLFLNFVERALLLRDYSIRVFSLRCALHRDDTSLINLCLDAVRRCKVQDLELELYSHAEPSALPSSLFRCEMLTKLDLCFPEKMFSVAALERLSLYKCDWKDLGVLNISAPKLCSLSVTEAQHRRICKIVIHGPSLKYFCCSGWLLYDYTISSSSMPVEATVELSYVPYASFHPADRWHRPLKGLQNVKFLTLRGLSFRTNSPPHGALPVFRYLVTLSLSYAFMCLGSPKLSEILTRSPRLESLEFTKGLHEDKRFVDQSLVDGTLDPPPPCFSSSLKRITIGEFLGKESEMLFLRILLRIGKVLEEIFLCCPGNHSKDFSARSPQRRAGSSFSVI